jgi:aspartyl-tRNA(Asn)/glutamyl-tRNA(Gln) amidotransferase subunit A
MEYIAGWDPLDKTSEDKEVPTYTKIIEEKSTLKGIRIGVPKEYFFEYLHPEVEHIFYNFIKTLRSSESIIVFDLDLHNNKKYYTSWREIRLAEAAEIHQKWLNTRAYDYTNEVRDMLIRGTKISAVDYIHALRTIRAIRKEFLSILSRNVNVIITPTTIIPAPRFDEETVSIGKNTLETRQALLQNTIVFNSTGLPAISIPIGLTKDNMPVGAQIIGPPFNEGMILSIAYGYECVNNSRDKFIPPCAAATNKNKNKL